MDAWRKQTSSHVISIKGKKRQKVVTLDQWVVSFLPSVPDSNGAPHAAMPPSHHQSIAGKGVTEIRFFYLRVPARLFHGHPPERLPAVGATASLFSPLSAAKVSKFKKRCLKVTFCTHLSGCISFCPRCPQAVEGEDSHINSPAHTTWRKEKHWELNCLCQRVIRFIKFIIDVLQAFSI